jgi:alkylation response protein AidB-like acyl-CoA dehydrogenase
VRVLAEDGGTEVASGVHNTVTFELSEEQKKLQDAAVAFARSSLASDMVERDREAHFDRDAWRRCAGFGVLGMPIPQDYGGLGLGLSELLAVMEGLGRGTRDQGLLFSLNDIVCSN